MLVSKNNYQREIETFGLSDMNKRDEKLIKFTEKNKMIITYSLKFHIEDGTHGNHQEIQEEIKSIAY